MTLPRPAKLLSLLGPFLAFAIVTGGFALADQMQENGGGFSSAYNIRQIAASTTVVAIAGLGMTVIILAGGIDLSAGTGLALASVVLASLLEHKWPLALALAAAIGAGGFCGLVNGFLVAKGRIVPFIVTLGTMMVWLGIAKKIADNKTIHVDRELVPDWLQGLLSASASRSILGLPAGAWVAVAMSVVLAFVLARTVFGRHVTAVGSNEAAARLSGLPVDRIKIAVYVLGGLFFGAAGVCLFSQLTIGDPTQGTGKELDVIAAVIIGGGSLAGGRASVAGTLAGAATMAVIRSGCTQLGLDNPIQDIALGLIIVIAVAVDQWRSGRGG
jgi:ribose transport system permease protein